MTLYIDGQPAGTKRLSPAYAKASTAAVGGMGKRRLVGDLDEVVVYPVVLTAPQILRPA